MSDFATLLDACPVTVEPDSAPGFTVSRFNPAGDPHAAALVDAVAAAYPVVTGRTVYGDTDLAGHAGERMTVLSFRENAFGAPLLTATAENGDGSTLARTREEANARLIASAPALLAAVEAALFALSTIGPDGEAALDSSASTGTQVALGDAIRAALRSARSALRSAQGTE